MLLIQTMQITLQFVLASYLGHQKSIKNMINK